MTERLNAVYNRLLKKEYRNYRSEKTYDFATEFSNKDYDLYTRAYKRLEMLCELEQPILFKEDKIGFMRTVKAVPQILTNAEFNELFKTNFCFDGGQVTNISSDYKTTLLVGFDARIKEIEEVLKTVQTNSEEEKFLISAKKSIFSMYVLTDKYKAEAKKLGICELAEALENVPRKAPSSFYEALVMFRIMNFMLWLNGNKHNTVGRFDVYMRSFYENDVLNNKITREEAKELLMELFISLNFDADLYPGIQQGDNGQSLVLGGCDKNGNSVYNDLSLLCLEASLELKLIDPKINLRVNKNTPIEVYEMGTRLTKQGLGFPQYSNDDVVIPALVNWGYDIEDARDYAVAACWEFIIPKVALDVPNVDALNFPDIVQNVLDENLFTAKSFEEIMQKVRERISLEIKRMTAIVKNIFRQPSPFQSVLMKDCVKRAKDISAYAKYNNYGFHGAGIANAADALAAIKKNVFDDKTLSTKEIISAVKNNFEGFEDIRKKLLSAPKMGNNNDYVDSIAGELLKAFEDNCALYKTERGGIFRAGTGTAMYYIWFSQNLGATCDGRKAGEPFAANFSPSLNVRTDGVLSVIQSFTKAPLGGVCNGGPLTLEFHDTVFRNEEGLKKVASLVKTFVNLNGHQLQLNAVNRDVLLDAQINPENHQNLIVRVWGWSGYFNELDKVYQNHIIKRLEFIN